MRAGTKMRSKLRVEGKKFETATPRDTQWFTNREERTQRSGINSTAALPGALRKTPFGSLLWLPLLLVSHLLLPVTTIALFRRLHLYVYARVVPAPAYRLCTLNNPLPPPPFLINRFLTGRPFVYSNPLLIFPIFHHPAFQAFPYFSLNLSSFRSVRQHFTTLFTSNRAVYDALLEILSC